MTKKILLFSILAIVAMGGCKESETKSKTEQVENTLQPLPIIELQRLFEDATYVDYIFYDLPFSISQSDQASIRQNILLIGQNMPTSISERCKPLGREFFHVGGDIVWEAEVYHSNNCYGYVFLKDGKAVYANAFSDEGKKFYANLIAQGKQMQNQMNGQQ